MYKYIAYLLTSFVRRKKNINLVFFMQNVQ